MVETEEQILPIALQPKQGELLALIMATGPAAATIIGGGGAKGGAKSHGADSCAIVLAKEWGSRYPGLKITIVRRVAADLKENHIDRIFSRYPDVREYYTQADGLAIDDARITFVYAETEADVERKFRGGFESALIIVDEAQQFTQRELQDIQMAARWTNAQGLPENFCKVVLLFNPGGKSSEYIRRIFWKRAYEGEERPGNYAFIHMFGWDNFEWFRGQIPFDEEIFYELPGKCARYRGDEPDQHSLPDDERSSCTCCRFHMFIYRTSEGRKYNGFPPAIRQGLMLGNFDHFEGQYFAGVWNERVCTLTPQEISSIVKPWWNRWMAQDWGFGDNDAHFWFVTGKLSAEEWMNHFGGWTDAPMDITIVYRELVQQGRAEAQLADDIVRNTPFVEKRYLSRFFLSEDAFGKRAKNPAYHTVGQVLTDVMRAHNLPAPETAVQDRVQGWRFLYHCFHQASLRGQNFDRERADLGPALFVSTACVNLISSIPMAVRDDKNPEDVARVEGAMWEDCTDGLRYGCMSMQGVNWEAPVDVQREELYHRYNVPEDERTGMQMTTLAMQMRKFEAEQRAKSGRRRRR